MSFIRILKKKRKKKKVNIYGILLLNLHQHGSSDIFNSYLRCVVTVVFVLLFGSNIHRTKAVLDEMTDLKMFVKNIWKDTSWRKRDQNQG